jgi:phosphotriesterase-related protein
MLSEMKECAGKALTVTGPVEPAELGRVMMHEHLHSDSFDYDRNEPVSEERPDEARRRLLLREAAPFLGQCTEHGCRAFVDTTMPPWRAWPTVYPEVTKATGMHIVLCTGFYREIELGTYWAKKPEWQIWPFFREASVEQLEEMCVREIAEGIHGTPVRAGAIKLGTSRPEMTPTEEKCFRAGARAQQKTGVHITTHCTNKVAAFSQLLLLDEAGVNLERVAIGHIGYALGERAFREACIPWMRRGATFLATNLGIWPGGGEGYRALVEGIHNLFDAGVGDRLGFGLDWAFCSGEGQTADGRFGPCSFMPPPPFLHMFTHTLPALRRLGLTEEEEDQIMRLNPQRIIPVH